MNYKNYFSALFLLLSAACFANEDIKTNSENSSKVFYLEEKLVSKEISVDELNDENFSSKIEEGYVLVDFFAPWCGPCRSFGPIFVKVAQDMQGIASFYKLNVDNASKTTSEYQVKSIPTIVLFRDGKEISRHVGSLTEEGLKEFVESNL